MTAEAAVIVPDTEEEAAEAEALTAYLPLAEERHQGRVTVHVPIVREFRGVKPNGGADLGAVVWEGEPLPSRNAARQRAFLAWVADEHLETAEDEEGAE